jgi:hypothetical protein
MTTLDMTLDLYYSVIDASSTYLFEPNVIIWSVYYAN